ncbi:hypothetical protein F610DRAFT_01480 [Streptomyces sp. LaPpAH-199]|uniref:hypothetical protein n=1 Tax=Streptomyces TaxID=1883 RepID=UPI00087E80B8|nr:hypothetical protein [Streptomyces sp. LaPpAH-199]MYW82126.1 hypothetical protein [Streptomyces sp. SID8369]SDC28062.1 hypothetical protein F610DRAFT_01480 [Streptomyces sp. LaPpAH-199]
MADLKNIALTIEATQAAADLIHWLGISEKTQLADRVRLGFAYAIENQVDLTRAPGTRGGSNYDTGGLDPDGLMAETVKIYYPEPEVIAEPYRVVETLMNKGLLLLSEHWSAGDIGSMGDLVDRPAG